MIWIIDYGMGNLGSVRRAFEECGASVQVSSDPSTLAQARAVVLPGVGSFTEGMQNLRTRGLDLALKKAWDAGLPILGICLGMQLLASHGTEGGDTPGLGLIPGRVEKIPPGKHRIPHIGWNEVHLRQPHPLFQDIPDGTDFYFVHSYLFIPESSSEVLAETPYAGLFTSAVGSGSVCGVQFHPEKSSRPGFALLRNFIQHAHASC
jgi:glutamine amidotransferase